jgi:16S rRNA (cytosine967-C5)-methyltransferase
MTSPPEPSSPAARAIALGALGRVLDKHQPLDRALDGAPDFSRLSPRDRAFARLLVATVLRRGGELDALIGAALERPLPRSARSIRHILSLGIAQILILETPHHAAVDTSVRLAAGVARGRFRGLVNAVLRRMTRDGADLLADLDAPRLDMPGWLGEICAEAYGAEATRAIARAHLTEPPLDLTLRDPVEAGTWAERLEADVLPTGGLRRRAGGRIEELPGFSAGAWWVQDAAASLPARLLPAPPLRNIWGKRILDLCAAPGGKTLQLVAAGAHVTALDRSAERLDLVRRNLARLGLKAELVEADGRTFDPGTTFDGVLLDAPCTASGTIRRHPDIAYTKDAGDAARLAPLQDALLAQAAKLTAAGGVLVYAVCSLDPQEGEHRVQRFLDRHPDFRRLAADAAKIGGEDAWITPLGDLRTLPFHMAEAGGMDGFYAARLQRIGEAAR